MLQFFPTVEGYVDTANESNSGKPFEYVYNYTDHLTNEYKVWLWEKFASVAEFG